MNRKKIVAGNWKMNGLLNEATVLSQEVVNGVEELNSKERLNDICKVILCPPFTLLYKVKEYLSNSGVALGAQDMHCEKKGAHTGDVSPLMLKDAGCSYVILGHSERRTDHFETNKVVAQKAQAAYENGLTAIICIGETQQQRENGQTIDVCVNQIMESVPENANADNTIIAYEPIWAIGTGKTPTCDDVEEVHAAIRHALIQKMGKENADKISLLYGGSVKPSNAKEFLSLADVDGALVGGASLNAQDFLAIIKSVL